jgi:DNA-nicking Smr family endonuclease
MGRKKSAKNNPSQQDFSNSPFKSLKGLSAFAAESVPDKSSQVKKPSMSEECQPEADVQNSFAEEMGFLGVDPLPDRTIDVPDEPDAPENISQPRSRTREESDKADFLDALGSMEKVFKDEWPDDAHENRATPRRMRQVERGQLKPEAELDLHGLTVDEASTKVRFFLQDAVYQGFKTVLLVTGKGLHSSEGPVLRQAVERLLDQQREQVIEWGVAPRRYGGRGALFAFLRGKPA